MSYDIKVAIYTSLRMDLRNYSGKEGFTHLILAANGIILAKRNNIAHYALTYYICMKYINLFYLSIAIKELLQILFIRRCENVNYYFSFYFIYNSLPSSVC